MSEYPILFTSEMVKAVLCDRKTQTRRIIIPQPVFLDGGGLDKHWYWDRTCGDYYECEDKNRLEIDLLEYGNRKYGKVGDTLWVREGYQIEQYSFRRNCVGGKYLADNKEFWTEVYLREYDLIKNRKFPLRATSGRFMYKSLARIFLEITNIRVERVQDIDAVEAEAEGMRRPKRLCPDRHDEYILERFQRLWDSINAKQGYGWDKNSWVWVVEFQRILNT